MFYVGSRYYDPQIGRFLNADDVGILEVDQGNLIENNLFAYCYNNPVMLKDDTGYIPVETVADVASIGWSTYDLITKPSWANAGFLLWDVAATIVPYAPGSYVAKGIKAGTKLASKADDVVDVAKVSKKVIHGNSLKTTKAAQGYALKNSAGDILKFGETTRGTKRYTQKYLKSNGYWMDFMESGSKFDMHQWQNKQITKYFNTNGVKPPLNKSFW